MNLSSLFFATEYVLALFLILNDTRCMDFLNFFRMRSDTDNAEREYIFLP